MPVVASTEVQLTVGVDTHADVHVAAALDQLGRVLATHSVATTPAGYRALGQRFCTVERFGIEGTGSVRREVAINEYRIRVIVAGVSQLCRQLKLGTGSDLVLQPLVEAHALLPLEGMRHVHL